MVRANVTVVALSVVAETMLELADVRFEQPVSESATPNVKKTPDIPLPLAINGGFTVRS